jgi:electron transport complex protein RnfC
MPVIFRGGVHPPDRKGQTADRAVERMPLPERLVLPMSQHLGAPCVPLVAVR